MTTPIQPRTEPHSGDECLLFVQVFRGQREHPAFRLMLLFLLLLLKLLLLPLLPLLPLLLLLFWQWALFGGGLESHLRRRLLHCCCC